MMPMTPSGTRTRSIASPFGPRPAGDHAADGIGQRRHLLQPLGHGLDALWVEGEAVEERGGGATLLHGCKVTGVGLEDGGGLRAHLARRRRQRGVLGLGRGERQLARRLARPVAEHCHGLRDALHRLGPAAWRGARALGLRCRCATSRRCESARLRGCFCHLLLSHTPCVVSIRGQRRDVIMTCANDARFMIAKRLRLRHRHGSVRSCPGSS